MSNLFKHVWWSLASVTAVVVLAACGQQHEKVVAVFDTGQPRIAMMVNGDGEEVLQRVWHGNGIVASETGWKNGKAHGRFKRWGTDGVLYEEGAYRDGLRDGEWVTWLSRGKPESRGVFLQGKREGVWTGYDHQGAIAWERTYRHDRPVGLWKTFYPDGKVRESTSCHVGNEKGFVQRLAHDGSLRFYQACRSGVADGLVLEFYDSGAVRRSGFWRMGKQDSLWTLFRATGEIWKIENWSDGVRDGKWAWFDRHAKALAQVEFVDGSGTFGEPCPGNRRFAGGPFCSETTWVKGMPNGASRAISDDYRYLRVEEWRNGDKWISRDFRLDSLGQPGTLASEGTWLHGRRDGLWRNWYSDGTLKDSLSYRNGEFYGDQLHYDSKGHLYMKKKTRGRGYPVIVEKIEAKTVIQGDPTLQVKAVIQAKAP